MLRTRRMVFSLVAVVVLGLTASATWAGEQGKPEGKGKAKAKIKLPEAAAAAIKAAFPKAKIEKVEADSEGGLPMYEVELKQGKDEMEVEVSPDGVIVEIETEVQMKDLPKAAAAAIKKAAEGAEIKEIEKIEIRAEVKKDDQGKPTLVKLPKAKIVFEAELEKGDMRAEVEVAADGKVIEPANWKKKGKDKDDDDDDEDDDDDDD